MRLQTMAQSAPVRRFPQIQNQNPTRPSSPDSDGEQLNSLQNFRIRRQRQSRCGEPRSSPPPTHRSRNPLRKFRINTSISGRYEGVPEDKNDNSLECVLHDNVGTRIQASFSPCLCYLL
ncbi:uncharacterized protein LOC121779643 isoform X2 [Salvia splendens]|uniref:uncharacterized protein LOC121779643 isoform X2 n=1 Tax=Salvia splendens TaxID=180675 RepID=UPI001C25EFF6|nr:uncharacterized protein LOC121779643 isoform X2 [Salvia splendens]